MARALGRQSESTEPRHGRKKRAARSYATYRGLRTSYRVPALTRWGIGQRSTGLSAKASESVSGPHTRVG